MLLSEGVSQTSIDNLNAAQAAVFTPADQATIAADQAKIASDLGTSAPKTFPMMGDLGFGLGFPGGPLGGVARKLARTQRLALLTSRHPDRPRLTLAATRGAR